MDEPSGGVAAGDPDVRPLGVDTSRPPMHPVRSRAGIALGLAAGLVGFGCGGDKNGDAAPRDGGSMVEASTIRDGATGDAGDAGDASADSGTRPDAGNDGAQTRDARPRTDVGADTRPSFHCEAEIDLGTTTGVDVAVASITADDDDDATPSCVGRTGPDKVIRWEAPSDGTWVFDTKGSDFDTALHVRDATCIELACNDNSANLIVFSRAEVRVSAGEEVFLVVERRSTQAGDFHLSIGQDRFESECGDGIDNDRDGLVDCDDRDDCRVAAPDLCIEQVCDNGLDDDLDGRIDCSDADCRVRPPCAEAACGDGVDNDGDGATDCSDMDCLALEPCIETSCGDGADNDGDGVTDCSDSDCSCRAPCAADPCPTVDLGMIVGATVAEGNTLDGCDLRQPSDTGGCSGSVVYGRGAGAEATFRWTAPAAGDFTFDTAGSDFDTMLYALDGTCSGPELACRDGGGGTLLARLTVTLDAGQTLILILDGHGWLGSPRGRYVLSIYGP